MARTVATKVARGKNKFQTFSRDGVLFLVGILGVVHETVIADQERAQLLLLFGAMMGLPAFLRADEARGGKNTEEDQA